MTRTIPNHHSILIRVASLLAAAALLLSGCAGPAPVAPVAQTPVSQPAATQPPAQPSATALPPAPTTTPIPPAPVIWLDSSVPQSMRDNLHLPGGIKLAKDQSSANLTLAAGNSSPVASWIFAVVSPFPTLIDGVSSQEIRDAWQGKLGGSFGSHPLLMSAATRAAFTVIWGEPSGAGIEVVDAKNLLDRAWQDQIAWALVPFEDLQPRWKVLDVDGSTVLDKKLDLAAYPLVVPLSLTGDPVVFWELTSKQPVSAWLPATNRDLDKMTVLVMTGVTALVRATAVKMEENGVDYPARDIGDWLRNADLTHISNEIAFSTYCPPPKMGQDTLQFCSSPDYIKLMEDVSTDIVEMTGNHMLDWNADSLTYTFQLYDERHWGYYAAGENIEAARKPLKIEDHGNKLAFIGCNPAGPPHAWATEYSSGIADCDYDYMHAEIAQLRKEGYLPIATFQYHEYYSPEARPWQAEDFTGQAKAGAVIVSGSQAHVPQAMAFEDNSFIHYGLGNLFFDQMDLPVKGTRREFIDRHVFYDGRYISTQLLTAMLEDYARPRPMTPDERTTLLSDIFIASGWMEKPVK